MSIALPAEAPPLREEEDGALRVGETRVLLELVVQAFQDGATPEAIVQQYPALRLADAYSAIAYYLRHPAAVQAYLERRERQAEEAQTQIRSLQGDLGDIRARLLARRQA